MNIIIAQLLLALACQGAYSRLNNKDDVIWFPIDEINGGYVSSLGEQYVNQPSREWYDNDYDTYQTRSMYEEAQNQPNRQYETFQNQPGSRYETFQNQPRIPYQRFENRPRSHRLLLSNTWNDVSPGPNQKQNEFSGAGWARGKRSPVPQRRSFTQCMTNCATTLEYAPVCGSDRQSYSNRGQLTCAQRCGKNVRVLHDGPC